MFSLLLIASLLCTTASRRVDISCFCPNATSPQLPLQCITLPQCISDLPNCVQDNTTLEFEPCVHSTGHLSGMIPFSRRQSVHLQGLNSTIKCLGKVGFVFWRSDDLYIRGVNFQDCGGALPYRLLEELIVSEDPMVFHGAYGAVVIANSYNVEMREVSISNSTGYGLFAVNLLGNSVIYGTTVSHSNYVAIDHFKHNFSLCKIPENHQCSGGNVMLLYDKCKVCSAAESHQLELSHLVVEYGASLETWDVNLNTEPAGGLTISPRQSEQYSVILTISDSVIAHNIGRYAGNVAVLLYGTNSHITFRNTFILDGNAGVKYYADISNSGGLYNFWGQLLDEGRFSKHLLIDNCTFENNNGVRGGAIHISSISDDELDSTQFATLVITNTDIRRNLGYNSVVRLQSTRTGERLVSDNYLSVLLNNTKIHDNGQLISANSLLPKNNLMSESTVFCSNLRKLNFMDVTISGNAMRGLHIIYSTQVFFSGTNYITGNKAYYGGGILTYKGSFSMVAGSYLYITSNQVRDCGGGIYAIDDESNFCFFKEVAGSHPAEVIMRNNTANISGNSIYGGNIDFCQVESNLSVDGYSIFKDLFDIPFSSSLTEVTSSVRQLCFCEEHRVHCDVDYQNISTLPGQDFSISVVAVGQLNGTTIDSVVSHVLDSSASLGSQQDTQALQTTCTRVNYTLNSGENQVIQIGLETNYDQTHHPNSKLLIVNVHTRKCPLGFSLDQQSMVCDCNRFLRQYGVRCYVDQAEDIQRQFPLWIGLRQGEHSLLIHKSCPAQYCKSETVNFTLASTDLQCQSGRSGILCGGCKENSSAVFGSSTCKKCSNSYLSLLLVFCVAGLLLVVIMIYGDLTVTRGTFNALIFYANVVRVHNSVFFPMDHTNIVTVFIAWLNLDFGIEVCFYDGMDAFTRSCLQYVFPAYVWLLVIAVILAGWHSKFAAKIFGDNAVQVLATLLLLSYTKIQRNILDAWSSTLITHENGTFSVWLLDGNIAFMSGKHIFLGLISLVFLLVYLVPFTFILLCEYPLQSKLGTFMLRYKLTPLVDAYQGPYKTKFRWWTGAMLLVRGTFLLAFGLNVLGDTRLNLILIVSLCAVLLGVMWNMGPIYKERYINVIETFFIVNLGLLSIWSHYNDLSSNDYLMHQIIISYTLVTLGLLAFLLILGHQVVWSVKKKCSKNKKEPAEQEENQIQNSKISGNFTSEHDVFRESLLN